MRRSLFALTACALLLLAAPALAAVFKTGFWAGKTERTGLIKFTVTDTAARDFVVRGFFLCDDPNQSRHVGQINTSFSAQIRERGTGRNRRGVFSKRYSGKSQGLNIRGKLKGGQGSGVLRATMRVRFIPTSPFEPLRPRGNGRITCKTPELNWLATHKSP
jgi:hypothetical protein